MWAGLPGSRRGQLYIFLRFALGAKVGSLCVLWGRRGQQHCGGCQQHCLRKSLDPYSNKHPDKLLFVEPLACPNQLRKLLASE